ncbi:E3 UFM1-protein ligase 1-like [Gigantopelta aegis]|uniref:E3 UFM1-protein ligase 1-like n=1 Tax=Gigantopelta aegis TaxID=1735272 RepID=UPI001B88BF29|nr:E3 UFM1-protein ligase 1-like [Gigantopelta aegis]
MSALEEVKRLQAEFKDIQLSTTKQKLSERNIIELVTKLVELRLINVIYTTDGKEYLTHQELAKEIKDELVAHGGRINLVDLQPIINVDFTHIQNKVGEIVGQDSDLCLVLGQLINRSYQDCLAEEINDRLQEKGHVTIAELTKLHDLPADFLSEVINNRLGTVIKGQIDSFDRDVVFTEAFVARMRAVIRGSFSAVTRPTPVQGIMHQHGCQERLFFSILEELIQSGRLAGSISGGRQEKAAYLPEIYTKSQNEWVDAFYKQNGYLEYDSLSRLGIPDCKNYIKKRFKDEQLVYLSTCCCGKAIQDQIESSVDEALSSGTWVDIMSVLPSIFSLKDANQLLTTYLKTRQGALLCCDSIVASESLIQDCSKPFVPLMTSRAEKDVKSNPVFIDSGKKGSGAKVAGLDDGSSAREDKKDQRRKKAATSTKSGGGTQGREIKTKSTKKKGRNKDVDDDSDDEHTSVSQSKQHDVSFMNINEIEDVLRHQDQLAECPEELVNEIATRLCRPLSKQYQEIAKSIFLQSAGAASGSDRKKTHGDLQEKLNGLWSNVKLFEKGLKLFPEDAHSQFVRHILKTLCTDISNMVVNFIATDNMLSVSDELQITPEARLKIISKLPTEIQGPLTKLHSSLNSKTLEEFFSSLEYLCGPENLGILFKKLDKKRERQIVFAHRQTLAEQLRQETDPAMTLHLASVILFQTFTNNMIHVPGRLVPQVIQFLSEYLEKDVHEKLVNLQELVVKHAKLVNDSTAEKPMTEEISDVEAQMKELLPGVKEIALTAKKNNMVQEETKDEA